MATTTTGVKITVDTSDIDIKFLKSVDQLNAGLTKTQRGLGLVYNEQGLLTNALGQTVEGLTTSQIKLGQYVDELGRVRTFQAGYAEGLSKTQLALGMYADELGNIYNATGEMIGQTDKAAKALEKEAAQAAKEAAQALKELGDAAQGTTATLGDVGRQLEGALGQLKGTGDAVKDIGAAIGGGVVEDIGKLGKGIEETFEKSKRIRETTDKVKGLAEKFGGATNGANLLSKAVSGIGKAAAYIYIVIEAVKLLNSCFNIERPKGFDENIEYFKELEARAERAGKKIKNLSDALSVGAFGAYRSEISATIAELDRLNETNLSFSQQKIVDKSLFGFTAEINKALYQLENLIAGGNVEEEKNAIYAQLDQFIKNVVDSQKTQAERLFQEADEIMTAAGKVTDEKQYNELYDAAEKLREQAVELQEKELEDARQSRIKAAGMLEYIDAAEKSQAKTAPTVEEFNKTLEAWAERVKEGDATQEEYNKALAAKQKEIAGILADNYGVSAPTAPEIEIDPAEAKRLSDALKAGEISLEQYATEIDALRAQAEAAKDAQAEDNLKKAFEAGQITADQYRELLDNLKKKRADQLEKELSNETDAEKIAQRWREALDAGRISQQAYNAKIDQLKAIAEQEAERKREEARGALADQLGVSFDAPKTEATPLESYADNVDALKKAYDDGIIKQEEYNNALANLKDKAREAFPGLDKAKEPDAAATVKDFGEGAKEVLKGGEVSNETEKAIREAQASVKSLTTKGQSLNDASLAALERYNETLEQAADAYEKGILDKKDYDAVLAAATGELSDELNKQKAEVEKSKEQEKAAREKQRATTRSKLGIDSLLEEMKSPLDKYRETMDEIAKASKEGSISRKERGLLEEKAASDYWGRMDELSKTAQKGAEKLDKMELGRSSSKGSESLYLAMVKQSQTGYQSRIQQTTGQIAAMQEQALNETQVTNMYLQTLVEAGGVGVFRG